LDPTPLENALTIVTSVTSTLASLDILPYVFAGAVIALIGRLVLSFKKAAK